MNEEMRERIALILESVAWDGVSSPRDLDVALDAIKAEIMDAVAAEGKAARNAALEEAASIADGRPSDRGEDVAAAIRAMKGDAT